MNRKEMWLVFSDLDGTLLDENYSFEGVEGALLFLKERDIPVILCSSKTRGEIELYRRRLSLKEYPFVSENGGGVFIPRCGNYEIVKLGSSYAYIVQVLAKARKALGIEFRGFSDLDVKEISQISGLSFEEAQFAKEREFSESIIIDESFVSLLNAFLQEHGLKLVKGSRFYSVVGDSDKGKAVKFIKEHYRLAYPGCKVISIGLGDGENDFPMLEEVDYPVLVRPKLRAIPNLKLKNLYITEKPAPLGWLEAIFKIFGGEGIV